jgi:excinuclease UvrABC ATPase subunit
VSGVSGSGKTTLVKQVLYNALLDAKQLPTEMKGGFSAIKGDLHLFDQIEMVDQNPIGKSILSLILKPTMPLEIFIPSRPCQKLEVSYQNIFHSM